MNSISLTAGVARRIITPPPGIYQIGYGDRTQSNMGVHDDLTVTALVFDNGSTCLAIVALDLLVINEYIADRIRARLAPTEVLLCCSHTHSGPIAYADKKSPARNRDYIDLLVNLVVGAVKHARSHTQPVRLEVAYGEASVGINRREKMSDGRMEIGRNPTGARDPSVQVISILALPEETRLATLVNYACHGTVLGPDNLLISADWIGVMRAKIEAELGGMALFLQGAAANINPDMYWGDAQAFDRVTEQGLQVAAAVLSALTQGSHVLSEWPLDIERAEVWLPTETRALTSRPPKSYRRPLMQMAKLPAFLAVFAERLLNQRYPWKSRLEARNGYWAVPMRVSVARIGDLALITFAAETFTEIGMQIKAGSPAPCTFFASLTDGCISYLHTAQAHPEGGYEVDIAPLAYRYPSRLQAGCEQLALQTANQLLQDVWMRGKP